MPLPPRPAAGRSTRYRQYPGRDAVPAKIDEWLGRIPNYGETGLDTLRATLITDFGSEVTGARHASGTNAADTFVYAGGELAIRLFDPAHDVIDLRGTALAGVDPLTSGRAHETVSYNTSGTDVIITLDDHNHIVLPGLSLASLNASDFLF